MAHVLEQSIGMGRLRSTKSTPTYINTGNNMKGHLIKWPTWAHRKYTNQARVQTKSKARLNIGKEPVKAIKKEEANWRAKKFQFASFFFFFIG